MIIIYPLNPSVRVVTENLSLNIKTACNSDQGVDITQSPYISPTEYSTCIDKFWPCPTEEAFETAPLHINRYYDVKNSGVPNYIKVRRPVPSDIKANAWDRALKGYHDAEIVDYLRYGWPSSYTSPVPPTPSYRNHPSALRHPKVINSFIKKELNNQALIGPFADSPFDRWCQISPLMTRDKRGDDGELAGKRVIVDLSHPIGASVNTGIDKNNFQGKYRSTHSRHL